MANSRPLIFISAAEPSADQHGADLIRAVKDQCPSARFVGIAGPHMRAAGCLGLFDMTRHAAMLLGVARSARQGIKMLTISERFLRARSCDAAILIDSPTLHLPLAAKAHATATPVLYYIAPQLWAWGANRKYKLRHHVDRLAVILPFEEQYFRTRGIDARYVGHPLVEKMLKHSPDAKHIAKIRERGKPIVALLPGSRKHVVDEVLRGQLEVARRLATVFPDAAFGVSAANEQVQPVVARQVAGAESAVAGSPMNVRVYEGSTAELVTAADLVLTASGTMALEVAFHGTPMIVMYNANRLLYRCLGRWLIHTRYLSLPNILAGREIVPEFMPYYTSTAPIAERAVDLLRSPDRLDAVRRELCGVVASLGSNHAADNTAHMLLDMIAQRRH